MMKKLFLLFVILTLFSCKKATKEEVSIDPKDILSAEKMTSLLIDIHLVEAELFTVQNSGKNIKYYTKYYYDYLTTKYKINYNQFKSNIIYYAAHIKEFEKIYEQVLNTISQKNGEIYKK